MRRPFSLSALLSPSQNLASLTRVKNSSVLPRLTVHASTPILTPPPPPPSPSPPRPPSSLLFPRAHRLVGQVVKAPNLRMAAPGFDSCLLLVALSRRPPRERRIRGSNPACAVGNFPGRVIPVTYKLALQWLPCQAPGVIGSALGLVGSVSVYTE